MEYLNRKNPYIEYIPITKISILNTLQSLYYNEIIT
ncbi:hypothetical protein COTS27_00514 [Spirochaetota bacterium]|nr:hypothetical protein COTS27_00514 [Spirochaetota bacterium]